MKIRTDFVSNSSSSSFMYSTKAEGFIDAVKEFAYLIRYIDYIILDWDLHDDAKEMYNKMMKVPLILEKQEATKYKTIVYKDDPNVITINNTTLIYDESTKDVIIEAIASADTVDFGLHDTWDERATRLTQLVTLLEYKGFEPKKAHGEHCAYTSLKELKE